VANRKPEQDLIDSFVNALNNHQDEDIKIDKPLLSPSSRWNHIRQLAYKKDIIVL